MPNDPEALFWYWDLALWYARKISSAVGPLQFRLHVTFLDN